jgi:imidazolonepropionase-like amidohydrolase
MKLRLRGSLALVAGLMALAGCGPGISAAQGVPTPTAPAIPAGATALVNGTLFSGRAEDGLVADAAVVWAGETILYAGPREGVSLPAGVERIDARGGTILPGIIDAHTHHTGPAVVRAQFLRAGVTTVCDTGSSLGGMDLFGQAGGAYGPAARGLTSGPMLAAPDAFPGQPGGLAWLYEVDGAESARAAVERLAEAGAAYIKVELDGAESAGPTRALTRAELRAVVAEAHTRGLRVRAHARTLAAFRLALEGGVDSVEHVPLGEIAAAERAAVGEGRRAAGVSPELERLLQRAAARGVLLVPTLDALVSQERASEQAESRGTAELILAAARRYVELGGQIALGNDYGTPGVVAGLPLAELKLLQEAGLSAAEALEAATRGAALACGLADEAGELRAGLRADVLVVNGDPLTDLAALEDAIMVIQAGQSIELEGP